MSLTQIRQATPEDLSILLSFEQGIIRAERPFDETLAEDPISYYNLEKLISAPDAEVLVAIKNGEIIASGYAKIEKAKPYLRHHKYAYLGFMYVQEEHRGKGAIGLILDGLKKWCVEQKISELRLEVYDENVAAIRSYLKAGFKKNLVEMRLNLDS